MPKADKIRCDKGGKQLTDNAGSVSKCVFYKPGEAIRIGGTRERNGALFTLVSAIDQHQHPLFSKPRADETVISARWNIGYLFRGDRSVKGYYEINYAQCPDDLKAIVEETLKTDVANASTQDQASGHARIGGGKDINAGWVR